jgi:ribosomal protein S18 acetylase RimI-like enzyme
MPRIRDRSKIRALLTTDARWSAYALGDLAPGFYEHCDWHVAANGSKALIMIYRGFETPVLFAIGESALLESLLDEVEITPKLYLHIRLEVAAIVKERYERCQTWPMWRMALDASEYRPARVHRAIRLCVDDLEVLERLYSDGDSTGESPDFFLASMLSQGVYFGIHEGSNLIAAAGTHLVASKEGVGAIGNVYTHRHHRGRGYATELTSAVVSELLRMNLPTIVLNVNQSNETAVRVYERLGFVRHCDYCEGLARDPL